MKRLLLSLMLIAILLIPAVSNAESYTVTMPAGITVPEGYTVIAIPIPADKTAEIYAAVTSAFGGQESGDNVSTAVYTVRGLQKYVLAIYTSYLKNQAAATASAFVQPQSWGGLVIPTTTTTISE